MRTNRVNNIKKSFINTINKDPLLKVILTPLAKYLSEDITDIHIDRPTEVILDHVDGSFSKLSDERLNRQWLEKMAFTMASISGQKFDRQNTRIGFKLPGGHRCQVISGTCIEDGFALAIRLNREIKYRLCDFNFNAQEIINITNAVANRKTILISGGTGSGKTSLLNTLIDYIPKSERILTIEDVQEIFINPKLHPKLNNLYFSNNNFDLTSINAKNLLNDAMRMNPSRIILGEIRHKNAQTFRNAINSGHEGSLATIHANSPEKAIEKLISYIREEDSIEVDKASLEKDIFAVIQVGRSQTGHILTSFNLTQKF